MMPLPPPLGTGALVFWRLDQARYAEAWDSGEGSFRFGGRWSPRGQRCVYAALDPATAILEVAVHKTFQALDVVPHIMTSARLGDPLRAHVVTPDLVPNPNWLRPGAVGAGQQAFGAALLREHAFILVPSVVSSRSWNLLFDPDRASGLHRLLAQEPFALDPRLHPPFTP